MSSRRVGRRRVNNGTLSIVAEPTRLNFLRERLPKSPLQGECPKLSGALQETEGRVRSATNSPSRNQRGISGSTKPSQEFPRLSTVRRPSNPTLPSFPWTYSRLNLSTLNCQSAMTPYEFDARCDLAGAFSLASWLSWTWCFYLLYMMARTLRVEGLTPRQTWARLPQFLSRYGWSYFAMLGVLVLLHIMCLVQSAYVRVNVKSKVY